MCACTSAPGLQDYATLPPPDLVQAKLVGAQIEVSWLMPRLPASREITGFHIYLSERSLIYTPFDQLPLPTKILSLRSRLAFIDLPDSTKAAFLHIRSTNENGDLSLPSLPEIHLILPKNNP